MLRLLTTRGTREFVGDLQASASIQECWLCRCIYGVQFCQAVTDGLLTFLHVCYTSLKFAFKKKCMMEEGVLV